MVFLQTIVIRDQIILFQHIIPATFLFSTISALLSTDVVSNLVTAPVIPEIVSSSWPEWVPVLHVCHTVLTVEVIWFSLAPVKPVNRGIEVRPHPVTIVMVRMVFLSHSSHPELITPGNLGIHIRGVELQQHALDPVVEGHSVNFHNISVMKTAENLCIVLGDLLLAEEEAVSHSVVLLPVPTIWTVVGVLPRHQGRQGEGQQGGDHGVT